SCLVRTAYPAMRFRYGRIHIYTLSRSRTPTPCSGIWDGFAWKTGMPRSSAKIAGTLANAWSAPSDLPVGPAGRPLFCVASTYTFHAPFFESELLPRFLGLKFDETEGVRPFVVEREQALATSRACVLVNADHLDPSQSTLRWDQF